MAKRTKRKIAAAVLAVVIAGIVYCVFFAEEKDGTVQYQSSEEATEDFVTSVNALVDNGGSNGTQPGSSVKKDSKTGQSQDQADEAVQNDGQNLIYVHVCGAVKKPAVYSLPENSRVCDAIAKAGGLTENAADDYVNQARFLSDGERVYIPEKEELSNLSTSQYAAGQQVGNTDNSQENLPVNINTAGVSELTSLPGIGESRAESIVAYREKHGAFARIEDIMKISGIKGAAYEKIKDRICTGNE